MNQQEQTRFKLLLVALASASCLGSPVLTHDQENERDGSDVIEDVMLGDDPFATTSELDRSPPRRFSRDTLRDSDVDVRTAGVMALYEKSQETGLDVNEVEMLYYLLKNDPEWRVLIRVMVLLPQLEDRARAQAALKWSLLQRDPSELSGRGIVPLAASRYLSEIGDESAIPALEEWVEFLKDHPEHFGEFTSSYFDAATRNLQALERRIKQ